MYEPANRHAPNAAFLLPALFADILRDLAKTVAALPLEDLTHRDSLRDAAKALYLALETKPAKVAGAA